MTRSGSDRRADVGMASDEVPSRVVGGRANWLNDDDPRLELNGRQYTAVLELACHDKVDTAAIDGAAHRAGVTPGRVRRWLKASYVRRALAKERAEPAGYGFRLCAMHEGPQAVSEARQARANALASRERRSLTASDEGASNE